MILENFLKEIRNKVNSLIQDNYTINLVQNNSIKVINPAKRGKVAPDFLDKKVQRTKPRKIGY
jgi:hypothetical protein